MSTPWSCVYTLHHGTLPSFRHHTSIPPAQAVLRALWRQPHAWRALQSYAAASLAAPSSSSPSSTPSSGVGVGAGEFGEFAETLVKEAVFLLNDALGRLADVRTREAEMADAAAWAKTQPGEKKKREERLEAVRLIAPEPAPENAPNPTRAHPSQINGLPRRHTHCETPISGEANRTRLPRFGQGLPLRPALPHH